MCQVNTGKANCNHTLVDFLKTTPFHSPHTDPMKMQTAYLEVVIPPDIIYEEVKLKFFIHLPKHSLMKKKKSN